MPSPERVEQLHEQLVPLGDEPAVAAERGELVEPPRRPKSDIDDDLATLLDDAQTDESPADPGDIDDATSAILTDLDSVFDTGDDEDSGESDQEADDASADDLDGLGDFGEIDAFELPAVDDEIDDLDEEGFSLGDFGEEFDEIDLTEESIDESAGLAVETEGVEEAASVQDTGAMPEREFTDEEFLRLQQTLGSLPRNVKLPTEEIIGEGKGTPKEINALIDLLIAGAAPVNVAGLASKILDKRIEVPKGYQKRSGLAFEEEKRSFAYRFTHVFLPFLRTAVAVTVVAAIVGLLAHRFVYQPIHAAILYRQGYEHAEFDRYTRANDTFQRAYEIRPRDRWFIEYAELYIDKDQYQLAVEKYDQLVFGMEPTVTPEVRAARIQAVRDNELDIAFIINERGDVVTNYGLLNVHKPAILDHAHLQSATLANYERADDLYSILRYGDDFDYEALMGQGDNFMRWADQASPDSQAAAGRYEQARLAYAKALSHYGDTDEILMRFLRFFVRTDNRQRVEEIVAIYENDSLDAEIDPRIYADAAGYLLDRGRIEGIRSMIIRAYEIDAMVPEVHYELARYSRVMDAIEEERNALDNAVIAFDAAEPLSRRRLIKQIDTYIRSGEYWYRRDETIQAQEAFENARQRYDNAKKGAFLDPDPEIARVYARVGDIAYYDARDYDRALRLFRNAKSDGYVTDDLDFKLGYIHYRRGEYDTATERFFDVGSATGFSGPDNVLYARANTLYHRNQYLAAEALYTELLDRLKTQRARIRTLLVEEDTTHQALVQNLVRVQNNLGVTQYRVGQRVAPSEAENPRLAEALANLQAATELSGNYLRDTATGERALAIDLAFLNIREILYPNADGGDLAAAAFTAVGTPLPRPSRTTEDYMEALVDVDFEPQIYEELPRDIAQELW